MTLKYHVGLRIKELRKKAGLTQAELADRIDRSLQAISQIERGDHGASLETIEAISKALKTPPSLFFPSTLNAKRPTKKEKALSAITACANRLTLDDMETLRIIAEALYERRAK